MVIRVTRQVQVCTGGVYDFGYQVVWCPRHWRLVLDGRVPSRCEELIGTRAAGQDWQLVALAITPGHVHLFVKAHRSDSASRVTSQCKGFRPRCLRAEFAQLRPRLPALWSGSCLAATVGAVTAQAMHEYTGTRDGRLSRKERAR